MMRDREAIPEYQVLEQYACQTRPSAGDYALVRAEPLTGRTHQIRVHTASIGHPVVSDATFGRRRRLPLSRQFLHASRLGFKHPKTGQRMSSEASISPDLMTVLELLRGA